VSHLDLTLERGEIVGLVGESGSGKSLLAHAIAGILTPAATLTADEFRFAGINLRSDETDPWKELRGREIGIVFQNPRSALDPTQRIERQVADVIRTHRPMPRHQLAPAVLEALAAVRIPDPPRLAQAYPRQLSGGMCQRVLLAIALAGRPALLIADEPTTGLDTTTQAAILELIAEQSAQRDMATLLITHDLGLARSFCSRIVVMHAGQVVETAPAAEIFAAPRHPYSAKLVAATPAAARNIETLAGIDGTMLRIAPGMPACRFYGRCDRGTDICREGPLHLEARGPGHTVTCAHPL
jgi:oligopeptide/dipeptide ABC transporter ATP-binding protein